MHALFTLGYSKKNPNKQGWAYGISRGIKEIEHVDFPGVTKKKLSGIFRGLGFWFWNFQGRCNTVRYNFHGWSFDLSGIFWGK